MLSGTPPRGGANVQRGEAVHEKEAFGAAAADAAKDRRVDGAKGKLCEGRDFPHSVPDRGGTHTFRTYIK